MRCHSLKLDVWKPIVCVKYFIPVACSPCVDYQHSVEEDNMHATLVLKRNVMVSIACKRADTTSY